MNDFPQTANDVVIRLGNLSRELDRVTKELNEADLEAEVLAEAAKLAEALAFVKAEGAMDLRKAQAIVETHEERLAARVAEAQVRGLQRESRTLQTRIDVGRTLGATIRSETALAGTGAYGS